LLGLADEAFVRLLDFVPHAAPQQNDGPNARGKGGRAGAAAWTHLSLVSDLRHRTTRDVGCNCYCP
jgi:hypothetical protein